LLGDGCITKSVGITCHKDDLPNYLESLKNYDYNVNIKDNKTKLTFRYESLKQLKSTLTKLELLGTKSDTKFIPEAYK
jgi:hypothetical protein